MCSAADRRASERRAGSANSSSTAAVISELDVLISVDTAAAHLAGALAKPVWLLVPQGNDWRWLHDRTDSPWYPTLRLFRQRRERRWTPPVRALKAALADFAAARKEPA